MSMIIKKLELQGFKSFADRTKLVFHPGITTIVGPNGTGKSNLVDAMLWILGGHRQKTVRGDRTEDVIFNGNAKKPALSMADAVLTLADEKDELVISHRAFRSGEGEYRMNGKTVRLKDIQDELWKHAIGEKEYFVIEQGAIGNFVTSKPNEKRVFIEEAAGTAFYKDKKRQAQNKLDSTEQNLIRLEDIIIEVEKAKNSLQRQAYAANRYRRLRERVRELTAHHYRRKLAQLEASRREADTLYEACHVRERDVSTRLRDEEKDAAARRQELWDLEKALKDNQEKVFGLKSHLARIENDIERESKRVEFFEEKKARAEADRDELLVDVLTLTGELEDLKARLGGFEETLGASRLEAARSGEVAAAARQAARGEEAAVDKLRGDHLHALQALTETKNEAVKSSKEAELLLRQEEKLKAQEVEQASLLRQSEDRAAALEREGAAQRELRAKLIGQAEDAKTALAALESVAAETRRRLDELKARKDEAAYHLQALRKVEEQARREAPADEIPGALGLLADLVRTSRENAHLLDAFWREEARSRVVPVEEFLTVIPAGLRGTYLLIPSAAKPAIPESVLARPGVIGHLKSLIEPDERLRDRLPGLQDAVLVADAGEAVRIWVEHPELNFLTPAGDLLLSSGLLRLGQKEEGAIAVAAEMRRLEAEIAGFESEAVRVAAELDGQTRQAESRRQELVDIREELDRAERVLLDREREHRYALGECEKVRTLQALLVRELDLFQVERGKLQDDLRLTEEDLARREAEVRSFKAAIEEQERAIAARAETSADLERRAFAARAGLDLLQEKMSGLADRMRATEKRREAATAKIRQLEADARASSEEQERLRNGIQELREKAATLAEERRGAEEALESAEEGLERLRAGLIELEAAVRKDRDEEEAAQNERVKHEIRKAEVERDLVNLDEMCWQELKKTLAELRLEAAGEGAAPAAAPPVEGEAEGPAEEEAEELEEAAEAAPAEGAAAAPAAEAEAVKPRRAGRAWRPIAVMTDEEVERELDEAREAINRYKAVNLMAEEEYLEQKKRYDFLVGERQDLRDSIASTAEAIRKIDEESKTQFLKALEEVNKNFQEIFSGLFKGGNAEVKLLEPDNPLESGVEIVAQPPGKRVQNLSLLSGGEKSLTSLAFLFALFRYRPSPFCFLDEVDAALDDANLARFLDLLKQIKGQTQFILITHNYKTMEVADYIYGTTMPEPNITRLLSVKLEKKAAEEAGNLLR